jgi:hypothetical protein
MVQCFGKWMIGLHLRQTEVIPCAGPMRDRHDTYPLKNLNLRNFLNYVNFASDIF